MTTFIEEESAFDGFGLHPLLLEAVKKMGFDNPTPIQEEVIPVVLEGSDVVARAQTGSGKTAAFCLPALNQLAQDPMKQVLVIVPTRELALQVSEEMFKFGEKLGIKPITVYGGDSISRQLDRLRGNPRAIIATPGRLLDFFKSKNLKNFNPTTVVLDEGDEMLNMGFLEDIQAIFSFLPEQKQTLLFSATMPKPIENLARGFLKDPIFLSCVDVNHVHADIEQIFYQISEKSKPAALCQLMHYYDAAKALIFCNTKMQVEKIADMLAKQGFYVLKLHGDMRQNERQMAIGSFRKNPNSCMVATDVAGRGISISDITHVFNFELPQSAAGHTHRIGRTGRAGNKGMAITLLTSKEVSKIRRVFHKGSQELNFLPLPTANALKSKQREKFIEMIKQEPVLKDGEELLAMIQQEVNLKEIALKLISKLYPKVEPVAIEQEPHFEEKRRGGGRGDFKRREFSGAGRKFSRGGGGGGFKSKRSGSESGDRKRFSIPRKKEYSR